MPPRAKTSASETFWQQLLHVERFVHFAVTAVAHAMRLRVLAHLPDVAFQRVEIEDQAGRLDIRLIHAQHGGYVITCFVAGEIRLRAHGGLRNPRLLITEVQTTLRWLAPKDKAEIHCDC